MHDKIVVRDGRDVIEIGFADIEKFHGYSNIAGAAVGFKALQAACGALFPGLPAPRATMAVVSGHPGSGVRDAIEMVTRAHTRGAYTIDTARPKARLNPYRELSFSFTVATADGCRADVELRPGVLPPRFFDLMERVNEANAEAARTELDQLKRALAARIVPTPASALFIVTLSAANDATR